jgi:hypothetical protein
MENDPEKKLMSLLKECVLSKEFINTQNSMKLGVSLSLLCWSYYKFFNYLHPLKTILTSSVVIGSMLNCVYTFCDEIFKVSETDTQLANKLRLYHQEVSYNNMFIPYFKNETSRVANKKQNNNQN